jgi:hypothetical protein
MALRQRGYTREVIDDFARYLYLPRVQGPDVLANTTVHWRDRLEDFNALGEFLQHEEGSLMR